MKIIMPDGSTRNVAPEPAPGGDTAEEGSITFLDVEIEFFHFLRKHFEFSVKVRDDGTVMTGFKPIGGKMTMEAMMHLTQSFCMNPGELLAVAWSPELNKAGGPLPISSTDVVELEKRLLGDPDEPA